MDTLKPESEEKPCTNDSYTALANGTHATKEGVAEVTDSTADVIENLQAQEPIKTVDSQNEVKDDFVQEEIDNDYDQLIVQFKSKLDRMSFQRLNDTEREKMVEASNKAKDEHADEVEHVIVKEKGKSTKREKMIPAVKFQDLDGNECFRRDTGSSNESRRFSSGASSVNSREGVRRFQKKTQMGKKKSVMGNFMKRGRTMRKTLRAMHINEAQSGGGDGAYGTAPPTNEQRLRMFVLKEILGTETEYLKLLQFMVEVMTPSIEKLGDDQSRAHSCTKETRAQILSNVREIHSLHVEFQKALEEALSPIPYHTHCIGKVFLQFKDKFHVYDEYCGNFSRAQKICYELEKDPDFINLIEEWKNSVSSKSRRFLHLEGFIISPVQRLCKYPLLLRELMKYTASVHKDHPDVAMAQKVMDQVTKSVNESERRQLMVQAIKDMENLCDTWEQSGFVSKQGFLTKRGGSIKSWYIRWFLLRGYELAYYNEPTDTHPLGVLDLTSYKSIETDASHIGRPNAFGIKMPDRTYYMYATNELEKQEWLSVLQWKFDCIERTRRQAHRPFETVVFSSLSSFLHPKSKRSIADDVDDPPVADGNCSVINTGSKILPPIANEENEDSYEKGDSSNNSSSDGSTIRSQPVSETLSTSSDIQEQRSPSTPKKIDKSLTKSKKLKFFTTKPTKKTTNNT